jgi:hypothetical protein
MGLVHRSGIWRQLSADLLESIACFSVGFHEDDEVGSPAEGFQTDGAGACKQIQESRPRHPMLPDIEKGFSETG